MMPATALIAVAASDFAMVRITSPGGSCGRVIGAPLVLF